MEKIKAKLNYFGDHSSLHGVGRVFSSKRKSFLSRLFWLTILIMCSLGAASVLKGALNFYTEGVISYTVETNYLDWETPFPAITVCEILEPARAKSFFNKHMELSSLKSFYVDVSFWNLKYCKSCTECTLNKTCVEDFQDFVHSFRLKCEEILTECWWNNKPFPCCDKFHPVETEYGTCFSFNSRLTNNESIILTVNRRIGLPSLVFTAVNSVTAKVHSPDDMVSVAMENILGTASAVNMITEFEAIFKAEQTINDISVLSIPQQVRGCLLKDEYPGFAEHWPFTRYSFSACQFYCRAMSQIELCNCTHHFMPKIHGYPSCNIQGLACLYKIKGALTKTCDCPMACDEIEYKLIHVFRKRYKQENEATGRPSIGRLRLAQLPALRVRRHAIRDMLGLVVDVGGVGGVFFGASLLSVIEIFYLFFIRK